MLQRQVNLANERGQELQAQSDVQKALVELSRVGGSILSENGVNVTTVGTQTSQPSFDLLGPRVPGPKDATKKP